MAPAAAAPEAARDIGALPFVANSALREPTHWSFSRSGAEVQDVAVHPAITLAVREAVRLGAGLSVLPDFSVQEDLDAGRLITVLPRWGLPTGGIHAVFPAARFRPAKVKAFVSLMQERM